MFVPDTPAPAPAERVAERASEEDRESEGDAMTTKTMTGQVRASCGCIGVVREAGTRVTGPVAQQIVSVRISVPCAGHPHLVAAGVTERFEPRHVELHADGQR